MISPLEQRILALFAERSGLFASEIASQLGVEKSEVNRLLYGSLNGACYQDASYRWSLRSVRPNTTIAAEGDQSQTGPLTQLCKYYLACLAQEEDGGIGAFAANKSGDLDYHELVSLPGHADQGLFNSDGARRLIARIRKEGGRTGMYFGYPCLLRRHKARNSNWEGFIVEPLLLFAVDFEKGVAPRLDLGFPLFNQPAIREMSVSEREEFHEELVQLEKELGLANSDEPPELDELVQRMALVRPEWAWKEQIVPDALSSDPPLSQVREPGIYNRAVLIVGERSPYTQGLEAELKELTRVSSSALDNTILGRLFSGNIPPRVSEVSKIIEVLPLNSEQRLSIQHAMSAPLTIITGPPGTGKSQVVTDLLITAAWRGMRVLFASKNNKAVDVVESRVNHLGSRPILMRVGANQYQSRLPEYLMSLLTATTTESDQAAFQEAKGIHDRLFEALGNLDGQEHRLIELRNAVDAFEREAEPSRAILDAQEMQSLRTLDLYALESAVSRFLAFERAANRKSQSLLTRILWRYISKRRFEKLETSAQAVFAAGASVGFSVPSVSPSDASIDLWELASTLISERIAACQSAKQYFAALAQLQDARSLEVIALERAELLAQLSKNAERLWKSWLQLQPSRLGQQDRRLVQRYSPLLKIVIDVGTDGRLPYATYRQYQKLFAEVAHLLPCWAVTSLSARGRIPFEAGHFDLVVFDEASQCDIASALPLLYRAKRAVIIGDPKQLSHITSMPRGQDSQLLQRFNLAEERPHWAYSYNSLFDLAAGLANADDIVDLRDHHRSHADIIEFSNREFYEGRLRVATRYGRLRRPSPSAPGIRWIDVKGRVVRPDSGSAKNAAEAQMVVQVLRDLVLREGYRGSVGVVSPFRAQANLIRELVFADEALSALLPGLEFLVDTVHKFQGDERDVMIFSPVVAEGITPGAISFLKNNGNLFNVAITRARAQLIVVGDGNAAADCSVGYLSRFSAYCAQLEQSSSKVIARDQSPPGSEYPVVASPELVSDWERVLYTEMYAAGIRTMPQYSIENYLLDFAIISGERRLNIEVDGERYHRNWDGELCRRDQIRNQRLIELGWDVMRFWVYEVRDDMDGCIRRIRQWASQESGGAE